ncbi:MAG: GNAT family N-acetyltransferase [Solirubrobacteraceae bacterium]
MPELRTERLLLRPWRAEDREPFAALNADPAVMEYFPATLSRAESDKLAQRIDGDIQRQGYGLWAVEIPGEAPFIGFVGLLATDVDMPFSPATEVGWRLARDHWGRGLASEAARAAIAFAFDELELGKIVALTAAGNVRSRRVMERLGMRRDPAEDFAHPRLPAGHPLEQHVLYRIDAHTRR